MQDPEYGNKNANLAEQGSALQLSTYYEISSIHAMWLDLTWFYVWWSL